MTPTFTIYAQGIKHHTGTGYWQVNAGPIILVGRPCRDITRARARAAHYVGSGRALARLKYLTCDTTPEPAYRTPRAILAHAVREMDAAGAITAKP